MVVVACCDTRADQAIVTDCDPNEKGVRWFLPPTANRTESLTMLKAFGVDMVQGYRPVST